MSRFARIVDERVSAGLKTLTHSVRGYIPADEGGGQVSNINLNSRTATVRIPNPHGGVHPAEAQGARAIDYIELKAVPLPSGPVGVIESVLNYFRGGDRGVLVEFRGANLSFPHVVAFVRHLSDREDEKMADKHPMAAVKASTAATPNLATPAAPIPDTIHPLPVPNMPAGAPAKQKLQTVTAAQQDASHTRLGQVFGVGGGPFFTPPLIKSP